jgi:hypothetical protein
MHCSARWVCALAYCTLGERFHNGTNDRTSDAPEPAKATVINAGPRLPRLIGLKKKQPAGSHTSRRAFILEKGKLNNGEESEDNRGANGCYDRREAR